MLKKQNRLNTNFEFSTVRRYGTKSSNRYFNLYFLDAKNYDGPTRFGFVVPNTFSKSAPERNRVKRVFREVIRLSLNKIKDGYWVVIYPNQAAKETKYEEISTEFNKVLSEIPISR